MSRPSTLLALASLVLVACSSHSDGKLHLDAGGVDIGNDLAIGPLSYTLVTEPDQGMTPIYNFISSATKTIDLTMYEITDTQITTLLTQAAGKGLTVRVILDQNLEMRDNTTAYNALAAGKVQVHWANPIYAATHQKTITIDGRTSAIMSLNFAAADYKTSRDFAVITNDAADVAAIESVFDADFTNANVTPPNGDNLVWSPTNAEPALLGIINGATTSLIVENEEMSYDDIVSALVGAASRGVDVKVVMENSMSYASEFTQLVSAGVKLRTYSHSGLYIHAKVILADYGTSAAQVFIGSENFSHASLTENRELGLIIADPAVMTSIDTTLTSDFSGGTPYNVVFVPPDASAANDDGGALKDAGATD